jgi:hypothetical protein
MLSLEARHDDSSCPSLAQQQLSMCDAAISADAAHAFEEDDQHEMRTVVMPTKNMNGDMVDSSTGRPKSRTPVQPTRNANPCQLLGSPQPTPDGFAANQ